jgi:hypothetical protein
LAFLDLQAVRMTLLQGGRNSFISYTKHPSALTSGFFFIRLHFFMNVINCAQAYLKIAVLAVFSMMMSQCCAPKQLMLNLLSLSPHPRSCNPLGWLLLWRQINKMPRRLRHLWRATGLKSLNQKIEKSAEEAENVNNLLVYQ